MFLPGALRGLPRDLENIFSWLRAKADMDDDPDSVEQWEIFDAEVVSGF